VLAHTGASGHAKLPVLPSLSGQLLVVTRQGEGTRQPLSPGGATIHVALGTRLLVQLEGRVVDTEERPIGAARVFLSTPKREPPPGSLTLPNSPATALAWAQNLEHQDCMHPLRAVASTDDRGDFRVPLFADQPLNLRIDSPDHDLLLRNDVTPATGSVQRLVLRQRPRLEVEVRGADQQPLANALVVVVSGLDRPDAALIEPVSVVTRREAGSTGYRVPGLRAGRALVFVFDASRKRHVQREVVLRSGELERLEPIRFD
jgi:hypothetical protein